MATAASRWVVPLLAAPEAPDPALARVYAPLPPIFRSLQSAMTEFWHRFGEYQESRNVF
jgi:hypothetical protein